MIKKIFKIEKEQDANDSVLLSWFDLKKPNLSAVTEKGAKFILKTQAAHLHDGDTLIAEDGYRIKVNIKKEELFMLKFKNAVDFAKTAYEIGSRHQPICIEQMSITVLNDLSIESIIHELKHGKNASIEKISGIFYQNAFSHHTH
ncbi:MAG: urease accessory protein UreE [Campylobacteraceae bacterium]|jgi:urease accessory protein|nr:urease accessory protein UreE [Campylobacteraceae bacterium]